nr:hypothetical protein [Chromobacterium sp. ASV5]
MMVSGVGGRGRDRREARQIIMPNGYIALQYIFGAAKKTSKAPGARRADAGKLCWLPLTPSLPDRRDDARRRL